MITRAGISVIDPTLWERTGAWTGSESAAVGLCPRIRGVMSELAERTGCTRPDILVERD